MNKKENAGYQRTHAAIQDGLLKLAQQKDWRSVTVNELCKAVCINRSTFYAHFQDLYAVMESISHELEQELVQIFRENHEKVGNETVLFSEQNFVVSLGHFQKHRSFYSLYLSESNESVLNQNLRQLQTHIMEPIMRHLGVPKRLGQYCTGFYRAGILATLRQWLQDGCPESPEEIAKLVMDMIPFSNGRQLVVGPDLQTARLM